MGIEKLIDETIQTWAEQRPDLDFASMSLSLKLNSIVRAVSYEIARQLEETGINLGEFDVLATLRRHGRGAKLTPKEIAAATFVTPSGLTSRLARLEKMGLITREADPSDGRGALIKITAAGKRLADQGIEIVVAIEDRFINELPTQMKKGLDQSMTRMIKTLDSDVPQKGLVKRL
jgi:DNA-binding MarR family transcriptional regulator